MDEVMRLVFRDVSNGVYRCGFAGTQDAYERAYARLFDRLDCCRSGCQAAGT